MPRFEVARDVGDLDALGRDLGWPLMLKSRKLGYDGYGNATCATPAEAAAAFERLDRGDGVLVEEFVPFERELAVIVARRPGGEALPYPVTETRQRDHVCHEVLVPAPIDPGEAEHAEDIAVAAAAAARAVGVMGVELFALPGGRTLVNELAPRPHNSGHYTIEACQTSQFENHLRGVLDLPLGAVDLRSAVGRDGQPPRHPRRRRPHPHRRRPGGARSAPSPLRQARGPRATQDGAHHGARRDDRRRPPACTPGGG